MTERDKKAWLDLAIVLIIGIYALLAPRFFESIFNSFINFVVFTIAWSAGSVLVGYILSLYPSEVIMEPMYEEKNLSRREKLIERELKLFVITIFLICTLILLFSPEYRIMIIMWDAYLIEGVVLDWLSYHLFLRKRFSK